VSLVTVAEQLGFMRLPEGGTEEDELQNLLDQIEALLLLQANRVDVPFAQSTESGRVEYHDGTGGNKLWLDYTDKTVLRWQAGDRKLTRVDGRKFGSNGVPYYVQVTYDAAADRTAELDTARLGIMRRAAAVWRQRGAEGYASTGLGDLREQFDKDLDAIPEWKKAFELCRRMSVF
jgi:hypothetical protein